MFQGPGEPAAELNKNSLDYIREAGADTRHMMKTSTNKAQEGDNNIPPPPEPWKEAHITRNNEEGAITMVTKNQITQLRQFTLNWGEIIWS